MNYVMHFCRNKQCNNGWVDKDLTHITSTPPSWKYCKECAEKLGIDYDTQTPTSNLTEKELEHKKCCAERLKRNRFEFSGSKNCLKKTYCDKRTDTGNS